MKKIMIKMLKIRYVLLLCLLVVIFPKTEVFAEIVVEDVTDYISDPYTRYPPNFFYMLEIIRKDSGNWELTWNTSEIGEGNFKNIEFTADDGRGGISKSTWNNTLDIKYTLKNLREKIETYIPDKSNIQRIIIANLDNRKLDNNVKNRLLIEEIKTLLEKKNCQLYFIGADNEITKTLASYFE